MRDRGAYALLAAWAAGVVAVALAAALDERPEAFAVGVPAVRAAAELAPGERACRTGIEVRARFDRVRFFPRRPGASLRAEIRGARTPGGRVTVCARNTGRRGVTLLGVPPDAPLDKLGDGRPALGVVFVRSDRPTMLSLVPDAFERAALFKAGWVGAWTFWALLALVALALPLVLLRAYRSTGSR